MAYVPLWVKSNYSFLEGASHPHELVERAHQLGLPAMAVTDRDGVYGVVRAHVRAEQLGIRLLLGAQVSVGEDAGEPARVVVLARDRVGWGELTRLLSLGRATRPKGESLVSLDDLCALGSGVLLLCPEPELLSTLRERFDDRLYALVARHRDAAGRTHELRLREAAARCGAPTVAAVEVLYHGVARRPLQDVLACIRAGTSLAAAGHVIRSNAEHELLTVQAMTELFADDPASLTRTHEVAARCDFSLAKLRYRYPGERIPDGKSERDWLREKTFEGAALPLPRRDPSDVHAQLERELALIAELDYGGYFLTMREIVQFCRRERILCQGRGSAANSAVCYCLGITAIDPVRMDLLFERFLSRERAEPPDIDLDIEHERREEVIQWVYHRYGRRHAAMVANVIRYRARSAVRDVGKALAIPQTALDRLAKLLGHYDFTLSADAVRHAGLDPESPAFAHLLRLVQEVSDFPRHLSIHPGGFLLGHEPVDTLVPIEPATMEDRTVIQWDKYDVDDLGLFKVDLLGLGTLTMTRKAFALIEQHEGIALEMATVPAEDAPTYAMISRADTVGVFQIESRAQMSMLPRLQPRTFYDLVIEVAIVRPGPIQGDMVHPYLRRRAGKEPVEFPHKALKRALAKTLGVPIFQEQVMKLAVLVADYTPGEADQLRRDMAAWRSSGRIEQHRERLISRMIANGIPPEFAERVFSQIRGFGEYGFPESHAASFALIAYVTSWLRCHHLPAFIAALLNAQPMGFYSPATIVEDAKHHGVQVRPICVQASAWDCTLEPERESFAVRMGMRYLKGFGERERASLAAAPGPYVDLADFVLRTQLSRRSLHTLAEAGGFEVLGIDRRDAIWALRGVLSTLGDRLRLPAEVAEQQPQFAGVGAGEAILWDYRTSMHSTRGHPLSCLRDELRRRGLPQADELVRGRDGKSVDYVGLVICRQRPGTASGVTFYTLEDESGFVNVVVWTRVFEADALLARSAIVLGVSGKLQVQDGIVHLVAERLWDPDLRLRTEGTTVRSFH
ncbi:MAG: error-prone DNA polymerase [Deltaproteobacteria bacterium]|nr:error-prone DNA polymerase [Deltaproteobacteria bacterium]